MHGHCQSTDLGDGTYRVVPGTMGAAALARYGTHQAGRGFVLGFGGRGPQYSLGADAAIAGRDAGLYGTGARPRARKAQPGSRWPGRLLLSLARGHARRYARRG